MPAHWTHSLSQQARALDTSCISAGNTTAPLTNTGTRSSLTPTSSKHVYGSEDPTCKNECTKKPSRNCTMQWQCQGKAQCPLQCLGMPMLQRATKTRQAR